MREATEAELTGLQEHLWKSGEVNILAMLQGEDGPLHECWACKTRLIVVRPSYDPDWCDQQYRIEDGTKYGRLDIHKFDARLRELEVESSIPIAPYFVECKCCWTRTEKYQTVAEAIFAWNMKQLKVAG